MPIKILIVDDHILVREGLKLIMEDYPDIIVVGEAGSGQEALNEVSRKKYDAVLLDISLPDRNGLDILREIKNKRPDLPVVMLTMHPEAVHAIRALRAGASGYVTKRQAPVELIAAIRKVANGEMFMTSTLADQILLSAEKDSEKPLHETLSVREYQVMLMIASGKTVSEIARELSRSVNTINTLRQRILKKMNFKTNAELIHYAIKNQLVPE
jgi:two-component system invasion response regulator UvrY